MMVEHFLQDCHCQTHQNLRAETWPADTLLTVKLYSPKNLLHTIAYIQAARANDNEEEYFHVS